MTGRAIVPYNLTTPLKPRRVLPGQGCSTFPLEAILAHLKIQIISVSTH